MDINIDQDGIRVSKSSTKQISDKAKKRKKYDLIESVRTSSRTGLAIVIYIVLSLVLAKSSFPSGLSSWAVFWPIIFFSFYTFRNQACHCPETFLSVSNLGNQPLCLPLHWSLLWTLESILGHQACHPCLLCYLLSF